MADTPNSPIAHKTSDRTIFQINPGGEAQTTTELKDFNYNTDKLSIDASSFKNPEDPIQAISYENRNDGNRNITITLANGHKVKIPNVPSSVTLDKNNILSDYSTPEYDTKSYKIAGDMSNNIIRADGDGKQLVYGGRGDDVINAFGDDKILSAGVGNDTINVTGDGSILFAGKGDDKVSVRGDGASIHLGEGKDSATLQGKNQSVWMDSGSNTVDATNSSGKGVFVTGNGDNNITLGNSSQDNIYIGDNSGTNTISNFQRDSDKIYLSESMLKDSETNIDELLKKVNYSNDNAYITFPNGKMLILKDVDSGELTKENFLTTKKIPEQSSQILDYEYGNNTIINAKDTDDIIKGTGEKDNFFIQQDTGNDTIKQFDTNKDILSFDASFFETKEDVLKNISYDNGNAYLQKPDGTKLTLEDIPPGSIDKDSIKIIDQETIAKDHNNSTIQDLAKAGVGFSTVLTTGTIGYGLYRIYSMRKNFIQECRKHISTVAQEQGLQLGEELDDASKEKITNLLTPRAESFNKNMKETVKFAGLTVGGGTAGLTMAAITVSGMAIPGAAFALIPIAILVASTAASIAIAKFIIKTPSSNIIKEQIQDITKNGPDTQLLEKHQKAQEELKSAINNPLKQPDKLLVSKDDVETSFVVNTGRTMTEAQKDLQQKSTEQEHTALDAALIDNTLDGLSGVKANESTAAPNLRNNDIPGRNQSKGTIQR